jgi:hypothetical protein
MMMDGGEQNVVMLENQEANNMSFFSVLNSVLEFVVDNGTKKMESDIRSGERILKDKSLSDRQRTAVQNNIDKRKDGIDRLKNL